MLVLIQAMKFAINWILIGISRIASRQRVYFTVIDHNTTKSDVIIHKALLFTMHC